MGNSGWTESRPQDTRVKKGGEAQAQLGDHERKHQNGGTADGFNIRVDSQGANRCPGENERDYHRVQDVRPPTQAVVAEHGAENQLDIENKDGEKSQSEETGAAMVEFDTRLFFHPLLPGKNRYGNREAEECLGQRGVSGGDRRREKEPNGKPSENALDNDGSKGTPAENPHPAALFDAPRPDGEDDGQ